MRNMKQMFSLTKKLSVLAVSAVLAACAVGPDYHQPETKSPDQFVSSDPAQFATANVEADFWKSFGDEQLNVLIEDALAANHDIRIALASLREARAIRGEARLDFAPTVTASGGRTESRVSERQSLPGVDRNQDYYDAGFDERVEVCFQVAPAIRPVKVSTYCIGGPLASPHIIAQWNLPPGAKASFEMELPAGEFQLVSLQSENVIDLRVGANGAREADEDQQDKSGSDGGSGHVGSSNP